jgi:uncharacterized cupredoxin-like copper-binding protein
MKFATKWLALLPIAGLLAATGCAQSPVGTAAAATPATKSTTSLVTASGGAIQVGLAEWKISPSVTTVAAGSVTFDVRDNGTTAHEFVVLRTNTPSADFPISSFEGETPRFNEDTAGENVGETGDMEIGATKTLQIDLKPGHYVLACNLPGHYGSGMHVDFVVT